MSSEVKRYDAVHLRYEDNNIRYGEGCEVEVVTARDYAAIEAECANLKNSLLAITARHFAESWKKRTSDAELEQYLSAGIAQLGAERDALRQQRDKLAKVLEDVEREHDLIHRMKNCEIRRDRGSFGIAVMSDTLALEWQALDKELQQLIDARHAALAEATRA